MCNLKRLCLDTNIYVLGVQQTDSEEYQILSAIGFYGDKKRLIDAEIVLSAELIDQIRRVGKYLWGKFPIPYSLFPTTYSLLLTKLLLNPPHKHINLR